MDATEFKAEYMMDFSVSKEEALYRRLAREYHERTESYDQQVCRRRNSRGIAIPVTCEERSLVNRNAKATLQMIVSRELIEIQNVAKLRRAIVDGAKDFERDFIAPPIPPIPAEIAGE